MRIVVIGGVAGGATAMARLRRLDEQAEIILLERGQYISFANCGLPYYVGGTIKQRDALLVTTAEDVRRKYNIEVRVQNEATQILPEQKQVKVINHVTGESYTLNYDKLLISTGSKPFVPKTEGIEADNVFTLSNIKDVDSITAYIKQKQPKNATVIGAGFIGLEMAENLVNRGITTTIVEMQEQVMPPFDKDMARLIENHLEAKGVRLKLGTSFQKLAAQGHQVVLHTGEIIDTDLVIMAIGVRPNSTLAKEAGLALTERGHIKVNNLLQTSDEHIYAIGDVILVKDYITAQATAIPLAGPANKQGREVAANLLGLSEVAYKGTMGTSVAKIFDLTVASTGLNEKALQRNSQVYKRDYFVTIIHPMSHASYYPGAMPMTLKMIFAKDGQVLGAQIVGYEGVDKRIDTIATTIHFKGTVYDLSELELAYAPPYSSAKDPVNYAGYTARNILEELSTPVTYQEYLTNKEKYQLLDVREDIEVVAGMLEGAKHIPLSSLRGRLDELDKTTTYLAYCAVGLRGYIAERILQAKGYRVAYLVGGYRTVMDLTTKPDNSQSRSGTEQDKFVVAPKVNEFKETANTSNPLAKLEVLDVCGMSCPGPIVQVAKNMDSLEVGDQLEVTATDPGFARDIKAWATATNNTLLQQSDSKGKFVALLQKGQATQNLPQAAIQPGAAASKEKTIIVFDGDLDKAIAAFIIATGACAMGNKVHMFFTFWGLSILRKERPEPVKKDFMSRMFAAMLPKGSKKLGLSKMNFMGAGSQMIRTIMQKKGVTSLEDLIQQAIAAGVELTACQMTMDIMGLSKEELIDGVKVGGVATMLADNDRSNMNLFI